MIGQGYKNLIVLHVHKDDAIGTAVTANPCAIFMSSTGDKLFQQPLQSLSQMVYYHCCTDGLCSYQSMHILLLSNNWQLYWLTYIKFSYLIQALNFVSL